MFRCLKGFRSRFALAVGGALLLGLAAGTALAGTLPPGVVDLYNRAIAQFDDGANDPPGSREILNKTAGGLSLQTQAQLGAFQEVKRELNALEVKAIDIKTEVDAIEGKADRLLNKQFVGVSANLGSGASGAFLAVCPAGTKVIGGGYFTEAPEVQVFTNGPFSAVGWIAGFRNTLPNTTVVSVTALCEG